MFSAKDLGFFDVFLYFFLGSSPGLMGMGLYNEGWHSPPPIIGFESIIISTIYIFFYSTEFDK
jgi:hypothetical protein